MAEINVNYRPLPTLRQFHQSTADMRCIVGPVGSGKTSAATVEVFHYIPFYLLKHYNIAKTRWAIIRNTYRELADTTQKTVFEWFPSGNFRAGDQIYTVIYPNGIEVEALFRSCDRPDDLKKFKSLEITGYWIDESIEVAEDIKRMLKNRIGRYPQRCPVRYGIETTNPPDVEHPTYSSFKWETPIPGPVPEGMPIANHVGFWQPPMENKANLRNGYYTDLIKDYQGSLDWIARYVQGEPGITVTGKQVYFNFRKNFHVSPTPLIWSKGPLFAGWDNTGNCPACVIVQVPMPGIVQVLKEYHTERMGIVDFVKMVVTDRNMRWPAAQWTEWGDPAGEAKFSRVGGGLTSQAELMREEVGIELKPSEQNWEARREAVESQLGKLIAGQPGLFIDPSCTRLINGFIGGYAYPEIGTSGTHGDKPMKNRFSHVHDALQYVLVMLNKNVPIRARIGGKGREGGIINWEKYREKPQDMGEYREVTVAR